MAFPTTPVIDPFTGGLSAAWADDPWNEGSAGIAYSSNNATGRSLAYGESYWSAESFGPDCEAFVTISTMPGNNNSVGLGLRIQAPVTAGVDGYYVEMTQLSGTDTVKIYRYVNGVISASLQSTSQNFSAGDRLGAVVTGVGTTVVITSYRYTAGAWAMLGSYSDTSANRITAAGYISLTLYGTTVRADNFGGGTIPVRPRIIVPVISDRSRRQAAEWN